jgi:penicillin-binding protein 2
MRSKLSSNDTIRGHAFPEFIHNESYGRRKHFDASGSSSGSFRIFLLPVLLVLFLSVLIIRGFYLTVINGAEYRLLSDNNRVKTTIIHAPRGIIFDRHGKS